MRTTVVLDDTLVAEARETLGAGTLRAMIEASLRESIRSRRIQLLREAMRSDHDYLDIDANDLEEMRRDRPLE